jgi:conjugal transfer pilus assembly protein TraU
MQYLKKRIYRMILSPIASFLIGVVCSLAIFGVHTCYAVCRTESFNPMNDICWQCVYPVRMGGIELISSTIPSPADNISSDFCVCGTTTGVSTSFWEPARIIETVKDPWCFNLISSDLNNGYFLGGDYTQEHQPKEAMFSQAHYYMLNVWSFLDLFMDIPCLEDTGFDVTYITEVDPTWNDDMLAFLINPEALLFGNPVAVLACMADAVAANLYYPADYLFWCMGSWGSAYPLAGHKGDNSYIQDNAAVAAKMIYKLTRELTLWDTASNVCGSVMYPIWQKSHYRMQVMKPVKDSTCHVIGRSGIFWASLKNPPYDAGGNATDNFDWVITRKKLCCVGYDWS